MQRIQFLNKEILYQFFKEIRLNSQYNLWEKIANFIGTNRSMLDNYRNAKILLPYDKFEKLLSLVAQDQQSFFSHNIVKKEANWGQIIGGRNAYKINKIFFEEGRRMSKLNSSKVKYDFDINMPLSEQLCEFIGVIIGDGCTNKYNGHIYQTQITGDKTLDKEYYSNNFSLICKNIFTIYPKIGIRSSGIYINLYSKRIFEMLTERFRIPRGIKCYTVVIPQEILNASKEMLTATLRGMFNTDGGVGLDKRRSYKKPYIRINYTSASPALISQISKVLYSYHIPHSIHTTNKNNEHTAQQIQINGEKNVRIFMKYIGFSNPRHSQKLDFLNK